jgi:hypothetical protein
MVVGALGISLKGSRYELESKMGADEMAVRTAGD